MKNFLRQFMSTTASERQNGSWLTFFLSAVGAKLKLSFERGFTTTNEKNDEPIGSSSLNAVGAKSRSSLSGFTLVELIVSIGVFATALTVAMTGLLSTIDASSRARSVSETVNNLNFVIDDMARRIRTGYNFHCGSPTGGDCPDGEDFFSFTDSQSQDASSHEEVYYQKNGSQIERWQDGSWTTITPDSITIDRLVFYVTGTDESDDEQTRVIISIAGEAGEGDTQETFEIQTSITQRLLYPSN